MTIEKIEKKDGIYYVTKTPNFIQKLFGIEEKIERYKTNGEVFTHFQNMKVFYSSDGKLVSWNDDMCDILNEFDRKF